MQPRREEGGLNAILTKELIMVPFEASSKEEAIGMMVHQLYDTGRIGSEVEFYDEVTKREKEFTTGIGDGMAMPHGKSNTVRQTSIVVARVNHPVEWEAMDGQLVRCIVLLAIPEKEAGSTYLRILATLAEKLMDEEFREALLYVEDKEELFDCLDNIVNVDVR